MARQGGIPEEAGKALGGPLGFAGAMASIAVELGFGLPGLMIYDQFKDKPCDDGDILTYLQVNGILGVSAAAIIFTVTCCANAPIFVHEEGSRAAGGALLNLCCLVTFYICHMVLLIFGSVQTWSSNCRDKSADLFDASRNYSIAAWVLFLAGPLFLGCCYCLGALIDIWMEEKARRANIDLDETKAKSGAYTKVATSVAGR